MKILKYTILAFSLASVFSLSSCKKEKIEKVMLGDYVPLQADLSSDLALSGDDITYSISVLDAQDKGLTLNEDINVRLEYTITHGDATVQIEPNDVFENPPMFVPLKRGVKAGYVSLKVKNDVSNTPLDVSIRATSRGYQINGSNKILTVVDKVRTKAAIKGSSDNSIDEGGKFVLSFSVPRAAEEDIIINITPKSGDSDKFINLPSSVTIKKGFNKVESSVITLLAVNGQNSFTNATLEFSTPNTEYPMLNTNLVININDLDGDLDEAKKLTDERWVYSNPNTIFMSDKNEGEVAKWGKTKSLLLIKPGDAHPNLELAVKGWKLINAVEFTPVEALISGGKPNQWGNRTSPFFAAQNVENTQTIQAVDNDKYSHITDDGYLMIWSAKDPGIKTSGGVLGQVRDYGAACLYQNKYDGGVADTWNSSQVKILPGTRVEARIRMRGDLWGFNPAFWLQGNQFRVDQWSYYGEVDILEAPYFANGATGAWQTFHWNDNNTSSGDKWNPNSGSRRLALDQFNIYWFEWRTNDELAMGINGQQTVLIKNSSRYTWWPFNDIYNKNGMHLLITFGGNSEWALGKNHPDWDKYLKNIPYDGSRANPKTPRMEIDYIRYYKTDIYNYDPFANGKSYMY